VGRVDLGGGVTYLLFMQILPAEAGFDVRLEQLLGTRHSVQDGCQVGFTHKRAPHNIFYKYVFGLSELYLFLWSFRQCSGPRDCRYLTLTKCNFVSKIL